MPISENSQTEKRNPFESSTPAVRASWDLGLHDGLLAIAPEDGRPALIAYAVGDPGTR